MRHLKRTAKLGRTGEHRNRMLASLVCSLIKHRRITTTVAKAKAARPVAEKMVTLGKRGTLHDRRLASARLYQDEEACRMLFQDLAPMFKARHGGYTRIVRLNQRQGDAAQLAILEWIETPIEAVEPEAKATTEAKAEPEAKETVPKEASAESKPA